MELQRQYGDKGLNLFAFEVQGSSKEAVEKTLAPFKVNYPVAMGSPNGYQGGGGIPHSWVVGVDGKIIFEGHPNSAYALIKKELEKIKYPGLGKLEVSKDAEKAAQLFAQGDYAKARKEAQKLLEKKADDETVAGDANHIVERVQKVAERLAAKAEAMKSERLYRDALAAYEAIEKAFKGEEEEKAAKEKIKEMKADKDIKKELKAAEELEKLLKSTEKQKAAIRAKALEEFAKKNEGTRAAADAAAEAKKAG